MLRILKASGCYTGYLEQVYQETENLKRKSYSEQYRALMDGCFAWSDFFKTHLESTADCSVMEVIVNADHAQRAWIMENAPKAGEKSREGILKQQIEDFQPDVLFLHGHSVIKPCFWKELNLKC